MAGREMRLFHQIAMWLWTAPIIGCAHFALIEYAHTHPHKYKFYSLTVRTPFINRGGRKNMGVEEKERQPYGIYTGCGHAHNPLSCHNPLSRGEQKRGVCQ